MNDRTTRQTSKFSLLIIARTKDSCTVSVDYFRNVASYEESGGEETERIFPLISGFPCVPVIPEIHCLVCERLIHDEILGPCPQRTKKIMCVRVHIASSLQPLSLKLLCHAVKNQDYIRLENMCLQYWQGNTIINRTK